MICVDHQSADFNRGDEVLKVYDSFLKNFEFITEEGLFANEKLFINKDILLIATESIFDDILRYKEYSNLKIADRHKIAGYAIKWLSKLKPIQTSNSDINSLKVNNLYAIISGLLFLKYENNDFVDFISSDYFDHLMYETQFRQISGKCYASRFFLIEKLINSGVIV